MQLLSTGEFDPDPTDVALEVARSAAADAQSTAALAASYRKRLVA